MNINLTEAQHEGLQDLAKATGKNQSELIRKAIDDLLESTATRRREVLEQAAGMWKDRYYLHDFNAVRREWNRGEKAGRSRKDSP